jgi:hypothetical protein
MHIKIVEKTDLFARYVSARPEQSGASSKPPISVPSILVPTLFSGIGLIVSMPFVPSLGRALIAAGTFDLLVSLMG